MLSFAEAYCRQNQLPSDAFEKEVFRRSLYPHARICRFIFEWFDSDYFAADRDFVRAAGRLKRMRDFGTEVAEFAYHPANRGFLRRQLRFRVSSAKLRHLAQTHLHPSESSGGD